MIKTLRIASIAAAIMACVILVFSVAFGARRDREIERFLDSPGAVEKFSDVMGSKERNANDESSPLVKQAETFASIINPPPKPRPVDTTPRTQPNISVAPRPERVTAKFKVIGTSVHPSQPEMSLVFIDEPGKGLQWIRQSSKVGHLIIEQVKDGLVVIRDGDRTFEMAVAEKYEGMNLLDTGLPPVSTATIGQEVPTEAVTTLDQPGVSIRSRPTGSPTAQSSRHQRDISDEEKAALEELVSKIRDLQKSMESDKIDSGQSPEEGTALMEQLVSEFKAARISNEEAEKLGDLGEELNNDQLDPNQDKTR